MLLALHVAKGSWKRKAFNVSIEIWSLVEHTSDHAIFYGYYAKTCKYF